ncbi:alpha-amylase family glycosyl hydrolase [[Mycoplasma] gypis]|uniref:Alpha-amylase family glycosyl hydrolase n=1 Tax=[Mycoplasma] gypis TaxID=92404 RepID=A0ABZ2RTQ3_9BACT|nr:alpha-amylase family glycosyl hydrolase [[Mycoplasma] gypis]MBN0919213.1 hypothetical protein [[Mycoplasma] gypis]
MKSFLNKKNKKIVIYQINTSTFKDSNKSGYGDYNGVISKIDDYIAHLGIDILLINNILDYYQSLNSLNEIHVKYGSLYELKSMISKLGLQNIQTGVTIEIDKIKTSFANYQRAHRFYDSNKQIDNDNEEIKLSSLDKYTLHDSKRQSKLDLNSNIVSYYEKILRFYAQLGCKAIVLENVESLKMDNGKNYSSELMQKLKELYLITKRFDGDIKFIIKTNFIDKKFALKTLNLSEPICDYILIDRFAFVGRDKNHENYLIKKFKPAKLFKDVTKYFHYHQFITSLASNKVGRINSRWGDEFCFSKESAKSIALLNFAASNSKLIYYGDELGMLKVKINTTSDFKISEYNEIKRRLESKKINPQKFFESMKYQNEISTNSIMTWSNELNAGFSQKQNIDFLKPENFKQINVRDEISDSDSVLNSYRFFTKQLPNIAEYKALLSEGSVRTKCNFLNPNILRIIRTFGNQKMIFVINLSPKPVNILLNSKLEIVYSTYANKKYAQVPKQLDPFESLILYKNV